MNDEHEAREGEPTFMVAHGETPGGPAVRLLISVGGTDYSVVIRAKVAEWLGNKITEAAALAKSGIVIPQNGQMPK